MPHSNRSGLAGALKSSLLAASLFRRLPSRGSAILPGLAGTLDPAAIPKTIHRALTLLQTQAKKPIQTASAVMPDAFAKPA